MKKQNLIWFAGLGALGLALFFAYKKRNVPAPSQAEGLKEPSQKKQGGTELAFSGSYRVGNKIYVKPTNLIPDVYGRYHNATGSSKLVTTDICSACQTAPQNTPQPTMLAGFR
jgi:hypothetical protein